MTTARMALAVGCIALALGCAKSSPPLRTDAPDERHHRRGGRHVGLFNRRRGRLRMHRRRLLRRPGGRLPRQPGKRACGPIATSSARSACDGDPSDSQRCCFARPVCPCYFARGDSDARSFAGAEILGNRPNLCDVGESRSRLPLSFVRVHRCDPADATSCDAVCRRRARASRPTTPSPTTSRAPHCVLRPDELLPAVPCTASATVATPRARPGLRPTTAASCATPSSPRRIHRPARFSSTATPIGRTRRRPCSG